MLFVDVFIFCLSNLFQKHMHAKLALSAVFFCFLQANLVFSFYVLKILYKCICEQRCVGGLYTRVNTTLVSEGVLEFLGFKYISEDTKIIFHFNI